MINQSPLPGLVNEHVSSFPEKNGEEIGEGTATSGHGYTGERRENAVVICTQAIYDWAIDAIVQVRTHS